MKRAYPDELLRTSLILEEINTRTDKSRTGSPDFQLAVNSLKSRIYQPAFWIRVALFVATWLGGAFCMGWVALIVFGLLDDLFGNEGGALAMCLIGAMASLLMLQRLIQAKNHYQSGVDDALALATLFFVAGAAFMFREMLNLPPLSWFTLVLAGAVTGFFSAYFLDRFMAFLAIGLLLFAEYRLVLITPVGMLILPLLYLLTGLALWTVNRRWQAQKNLFYEDLVDFVEACSLVIVALSMQFVLVQMAFYMLMNAVGPLPYARVFQVLSVLIPGVMLAMGWKQKNRAMLWVGYIVLAYAVFSVGGVVLHWSLEVGLIVVGGVSAGLGYWLYLQLKNNRLPGADMNPETKAHFLQDALSQVIQTSVATERPEPKVEPKFGGGEFGGAGATGDF